MELNSEKLYRVIGQAAYAEATDQEKAIVKFGMTPKSLLDRMDIELNEMGRDGLRGFALGVMDEAEKDGGMRV